MANSFWIALKLFHNSGGFSRYCLTAGIFVKVGWMTHENEIALPSIPPSQERLLRFRRHHQHIHQPDVTKIFSAQHSTGPFTRRRIHMTAVKETIWLDVVAGSWQYWVQITCGVSPIFVIVSFTAAPFLRWRFG